MPQHWRRLAHERNSIFKCNTKTIHHPWGPEKYNYTMMKYRRHFTPATQALNTICTTLNLPKQSVVVYVPFSQTACVNSESPSKHLNKSLGPSHVLCIHYITWVCTSDTAMFISLYIHVGWNSCQLSFLYGILILKSYIYVASSFSFRLKCGYLVVYLLYCNLQNWQITMILFFKCCFLKQMMD